MFTGLVQQKGCFRGLKRSAGGAVIDVGCAPWADDPLVPGESVAVQGACLTVADVSPTGFTADVLEETLACTTLGSLKGNAPLNLERALRLSDRLGGHIVSGHVDGVGVIASITARGRDYCVRVACRREEARYVVRKGSIAIDGISLTVSAVPKPLEFEVCVIPTTWRETSIGSRVAGDGVNLETDLIGRYVERLAQGGLAGVPSLTLETLLNSGF